MSKEMTGWLSVVRIVPAIPFGVVFWILFISLALVTRVMTAISGTYVSADIFDVGIRWHK